MHPRTESGRRELPMTRRGVLAALAIASLAILGAIAEAAAPAAAANPVAAPEDPAHAELRQLRDALVAAIGKSDVDAIVKLLDDDVVVTWQDGETSRKPQGVREYYERMTTGPNRVVERVEIDPSVDELTRLYGDTGVATGGSRDLFVLMDGRQLKFDNRWTATVVKKDGQWRLASFHVSASAFDNPVLNLAVRTTLLWSLGLGIPIAFFLGLLTYRMWPRRGAPQ